MIDQKTSTFLNLARWLSAWAVFISHLRGELFVAYVNFEVHGLGVQIFAFLSAFGRPAVIVFFVLSGYLVGGPMLKKINNNNVDRSVLIRYLLDRLTRLYIVLIPALIFSAVLASVIWCISGYTDERLFTYSYSLQTMGINLLFLQGVKGPMYGGNFPLWSLTNEFWYYMLFPALLILFRTRNVMASLGSLLFVILASLLLYPSSVILYGLVWLMGSGAFMCNKRYLPVPLSVIVFIVAISITRIHYSGGFFPADAAVGFTFSMLLVSIQNSIRPYVWLTRGNGFHKVLADFSYTLYVLHVPLIMFFVFLLKHSSLQNEPAQPTDSKAWIVFLCVGMIVTLSCFTFAYLTERNTKKIRSVILNRIGINC